MKPQEAAARTDLAALADLADAALAGDSVALREMVACIGEITHKLVEAEKDNARQAQMLDQIHDSVVTMDLAGYITSWNKGAQRLFGYSPEEAIGRNILFLYADENEDDACFEDAFLEHGGRELEVRRRRKSGEVFWASLSLSRMRAADGQPIGLIAYLADASERKQAAEKINTLAYYDVLTGLPNRTLLHKLVGQALSEAKRDGSHGALLFIDLNRFKPINDTLGHEVGDRLLTQVGERLRAVLRGEDVMARLGGDEFVAALFDITRRDHAGIVAQKLIDCLDEPFIIDGYELRLGASIGISVYPQDGLSTETLMRYADVAMYRAKQTQQSGYLYYSQEMNQRSLDRLKIENGLRLALHHGELVLHYQPKTDAARSGITGAEALVRWRHPERGMIPPGDFIPVAEDSGLIVEIGEWVLEQACRDAAAWQRAGLPPTKIAVNISARQVAARLPRVVATLLARYQLAAEWIELELTESMVMHGSEGVIAMMDELHTMGIALALDDFGTGYSSLSYLKRFPIDTLKIDRSFIAGIPDDASDCAIAGAILSMAKQLGHKVIAEGVETEAQLDFLAHLGCDGIQGYLYSRPLPGEDFAKLLKPRQAE